MISVFSLLARGFFVARRFCVCSKRAEFGPCDWQHTLQLGMLLVLSVLVLGSEGHTEVLICKQKCADVRNYAHHPSVLAVQGVPTTVPT